MNTDLSAEFRLSSSSLPLTGRGYLAYRSISIVLISFVSMVLVVPVIGLVTVPVSVLLASAAVGPLWSIGTALLISTYASNTVEGLAIGKFVGFSIMIPVVAVVLVPEPFQYLAGLDPVYWPFTALVSGAAGAPFGRFWSTSWSVCSHTRSSSGCSSGGSIRAPHIERYAQESQDRGEM